MSEDRSSAEQNQDIKTYDLLDHKSYFTILHLDNSKFLLCESWDQKKIVPSICYRGSVEQYHLLQKTLKSCGSDTVSEDRSSAEQKSRC